MSVIDASTKDILFSQVTKKVSTAIGNWVQTLYPNIQRPSCPWCHTKGVELHRCHVGPRKIDIVRAEMDVLWKLSTAMGQMPNMDTFVQRVTERVKQDHTDGLTRIEIACGACNPYFEQMQLTKLVELNQFCGRDRKTMWNIYKKRVDNPNPAKKRRVEPTITNYFRGPMRPHDADHEDDEDQEEDQEEDDEKSMAHQALLTDDQLITSWLHDKAVQTRRSYKARFEDWHHYLRKHHVQLLSIKMHHVHAYLSSIKNVLPRPVAAIIKSFYRFATTAGHIEQNPLESLRLGKQPPPKVAIKLTKAQIRKILATSKTFNKKGSMHYMLCNLAVFSDLLRVEMAALQTDDITKHHDESFSVFVRSGRASKQRSVALPDKFGRELYAFAQAKGPQMSLFEATAQTIANRWKAVCSAAGLPACSNHWSRYEDSEEEDSEEEDSEEEDSEEEDSEEEHLRTALERMRGPLRPKNRFKNNFKWLMGELQKESERKWIHTSTLKEIYSAIFRKPAMGHLANDRDWLRSAIQGFPVQVVH